MQRSRRLLLTVGVLTLASGGAALGRQGPATAPAAASAPAWPPRPDFATNIDYVEWYRRVMHPQGAAGDNAYLSYRAIMPRVDNLDAQTPDVLRFEGFRSSPVPPAGFPRPWDPARHPDWERSWQRTRDTLRMFADAARRPYAVFPITFGGYYGEQARALGLQPRRLFNIRLLYLPYFLDCARGLSEAGWRGIDNIIDASAFVGGCEARLRAAAHLEGDMFAAPYLTGLQICRMTYDDIVHALDQRLLNAADRARLAALIDRVNPATPDLSRMLRGECAAAYDLLQFLTDSQAAVGPRIAQDRWSALAGATVVLSVAASASQPASAPASQAGAIDPAATAESIRSYFLSVDRLSQRPYRAEQRDALLQEWRRAADTNEFTQHFLASYRGVYLDRLRTEAWRRAVRVILALHAFHDHSGRWPVRLSDLPNDLRAGTIDPFSHRPFVYRVDQGKFILYSVAENGRDDGGAYDPDWSHASLHGDYVFWPVPVPPPPASASAPAASAPTTPRPHRREERPPPRSADAPPIRRPARPSTPVASVSRADLGKTLTLEGVVIGIYHQKDPAGEMLNIVRLLDRDVKILAAWNDGVAAALPKDSRPKRGDRIRVTGILQESFGELELRVEKADQVEMAN